MSTESSNHPSLRGSTASNGNQKSSHAPHDYDYDYLVIGGGSGGVSSAKRAAQLFGKKVCIVEGGRWGGTCVNVGCVPKKILWTAAHVRQTLIEAPRFALSSGDTTTETDAPPPPITMDWKLMKEKRDQYIARLNSIYRNGLLKAGDVTIEEGWASFVDAHTVSIKMADGTTKQVTSQYITIATGGKPMMPSTGNDDGVAEHSITSDGFFDLDTAPTKVVVVGAGYIAVELAGVMHGLGVEHVHLVVRKSKALRNFDDEISDFLDQEMTKSGISMHRNTGGVAKVELVDDGTKTVTTVSGETIAGVDVVLMAPGRVPNLDGLELDRSGVEATGKGGGTIVVDDYQQTNIPHIMALGDVCSKGVELTPMAIAAGRRLADRLFGPELKQGDAIPKTSYENVPTVVFSHPPIGTIGMSEKEAVSKYGESNIKIYRSTFVNLYYSMFDDVMAPNEKPKTLVKLICAGVNEQVVGLHIIGMAADEMLQGFGVAMKMGATKADLDSCIAIHPTASEEVVTLGTWGTSPQATGAKVSPLMGAAAGEPVLQSKM